MPHTLPRSNHPHMKTVPPTVARHVRVGAAFLLRVRLAFQVEHTELAEPVEMPCLRYKTPAAGLRHAQHQQRSRNDALEAAGVEEAGNNASSRMPSGSDARQQDDSGMHWHLQSLVADHIPLL